MRNRLLLVLVAVSAALSLSLPATAHAAVKPRTHSTARNTVYYAEGTIRLVAQHNFCLTYQIAETEGSRVIWYPCTTIHGKPLSLQLWYTEKVLNVGSISEWGYPWVLGKSHTARDLYARVYKLAEKPKMKFYTTFNIDFHEHIGWQAWMKIGPKIYVLSGPKGMNATKAKVKPYYATLTNGKDLRNRHWALDFVPGFKAMDSTPGR